MAKRKLTKEQIHRFRKLIWGYYRKHQRTLLWRKTRSPYQIVVSEIMLQQTQVERVKRYYPRFISVFPNWETLARAPLKKILTEWQGMGYNRRALYLMELAKTVREKYQGKLPKNTADLIGLPGIGKATGGAIQAYAYNLPSVFVETNIRRVFIHFFFKKRGLVDDSDIFSLVAQVIDLKNPREWYWALMDYGNMLARKEINPNRKSKHYIKQSSFEGSTRQMRSLILKMLLRSPLTFKRISGEIKKKELLLKKILRDLIAEGLIKKKGPSYRIS